MTTHIMIDTETLGTRPGSVVLSVALVRFSDLSSMSVNLHIGEQQTLGLEVDPNTHAWWGTQPPETWQKATENAYPLATALPHIAAWIAWATGGGSMFIWCHGAGFDCPLLQEVYRRAGVQVPWHYRNVRDTRTLYDLAGVDLAAFSNGQDNGQDHVALGDAMAQTMAAREAMARLMRVAA